MFSIDFRIFKCLCSLQNENGLALLKMKFKACRLLGPKESIVSHTNLTNCLFVCQQDRSICLSVSQKMQMLGGLWIFIPFLQRYCLNLFKFFLTLCKYSWRAWCQDPIGHGCLGSILIIQYAHFWPRGDTPTWGAVNLKFNLSAYLHNLGGKCIITKDQGVGW